jgi:mono/diheme cytochrome c family protein
MLFVLLGGLILAWASDAPSARPALAAGQAASDGWQIGRDAEDLINPLAMTPAVASRGRDVYRTKCQRCHGIAGRGNGPDADPEHSPGDLTDPRRASRNPDGVLYYKIWNGRTRPKMPAFKADISRDDVWSVIHHIKTLRTP